VIGISVLEIFVLKWDCLEFGSFAGSNVKNYFLMGQVHFNLILEAASLVVNYVYYNCDVMYIS